MGLGVGVLGGEGWVSTSCPLRDPTVAGSRQTTLAANLSHMLTVRRDLTAPRASRLLSFLGGKLVGVTLCVGCFPAFAGDLLLSLGGDTRETSLAHRGSS